jgi:uncharacterized damage-inducible protein DinB
MRLTQSLIDELDREAARTRRVLANVPVGRDDWAPHEKSMPLGRLAGLVALMPTWVNLIIDQDELDLTPPPGAEQFQPPPTNDLVPAHDAHIVNAKNALSKTTDDYLLTTRWRLKAGGQIVMDESRHIVLRDTLNHWAHHRGQLTVYLRLLGQPVPSVYGPSADDQRFL